MNQSGNRNPILLAASVAACLVASVPAVVLPQPVKAQPDSGGGPELVCMVQVAKGDDRSLSIVLPAGDAAAMRSLGFSEVPCRDAFASRAAILKWRDRTCEMAANPDERMQELVENRFGARPAVFCGMAEAAIGQWRRSRSAGN